MLYLSKGQDMINKIALNVSGKTIYKSIRFKKQKEFRNKAILNRTKSELKAQEIIEKYFILHKDFNIEFWFQFRRFDFFFPLIRTVIEIDGGYHQEKEQLEYDIAVDDHLNQKHNIKVIRVKNEDVERCLDDICKSLLTKYKIKESNINIDKTHKQKVKRKNKIEQRYKIESNYYHKLLKKKEYLEKKKISESRKIILRKSSKNIE
jgi:very-short-patch-repair endonuclease